MWTFDGNRDGYLTESEVKRMVKANSPGLFGFLSYGRLASSLEFGLLMRLAGTVNAQGERELSREQMKSFYDGTLFAKLAAERASAQATSRTGEAAHDVKGAAGKLPQLALEEGGPFAGSAARANHGKRLAEEEGTSLLASLAVGTMKSVCPYLG
jgi:hypothetical protein